MKIRHINELIVHCTSVGKKVMYYSRKMWYTMLDYAFIYNSRNIKKNIIIYYLWFSIVKKWLKVSLCSSVNVLLKSKTIFTFSDKYYSQKLYYIPLFLFAAFIVAITTEHHYNLYSRLKLNLFLIWNTVRNILFV